jgi:hypothetical protein
MVCHKKTNVGPHAVETPVPLDRHIPPGGMLDKLTREEILDLISYIAAAGDPNHPLSRGTMPGDMGTGTQGGIEDDRRSHLMLHS